MFETVFQVSSFKFQVSSFKFQVSSFKFQVSSFKFQVSSFKFLEQRSSNRRSPRVPAIWQSVSGVSYTRSPFEGASWQVLFHLPEYRLVFGIRFAEPAKAYLVRVQVDFRSDRPIRPVFFNPEALLEQADGAALTRALDEDHGTAQFSVRSSSQGFGNGLRSAASRAGMV